MSRPADRRTTRRCLGRCRTTLSFEPLEVRVMLTTDFAYIGDYGTDLAAGGIEGIATLINRESDPDFPVLSPESALSPYNPDTDALQDFIIGGGDGRYSFNTFEGVHRHFCSYLADVEETNCTSAFGFPVSGDDLSNGKRTVNRFFPATGNHDYTDGGAANPTGNIEQYTDYFNLPGNGVNSENSVAPSTNASSTELYYDFLQGGTVAAPLIQVFVLDSYAMLEKFDDNDPLESRQEQYEWLRDGLQSSRATWKIVVGHHSPYASTSRGPNEALQFPFAHWGVDLVLSAHEHVYERIERDGTTFVVNGSSGPTPATFGTLVEGSESYVDEHGAVFFSANETELTGYYKTVAGEVVDTFSVQQTQGFALPCDLAGGNGCNLADIDALYANMNLQGIEGQVREDMINDWLSNASS